jgi:ferredoxin
LIANYGYEDASGSYFISIDTDECNGCGECVRACAPAVLKMIVDDYGKNVPCVEDTHRKTLRYDCAPCKSRTAQRQFPCVVACRGGAVAHSW